MTKTISFNQFGKELEKMIKKDVDNVKRAAAKALNLSARKARTEIAKAEQRQLGFKSKNFKKHIKIEKASKNNLCATLNIPNSASEVTKDGKTFLMIPSKKGLGNIGYSKDQIKKNLASDLLKYADEHPFKTAGHTTTPQPFFKPPNFKSSKTGQVLIASRNKEKRKDMDWLYVGREGKEPDFDKIASDAMNKNLEKDFERELNKLTKK